MGIGVMICGLNGSGKSTLGKRLSEKLRFTFIDNEDLFFEKTDTNYLFASPRTKEEAIEILMNKVNACENFIFAAVKPDYGEAILSLFQYAIVIDVPKDIRIKRVKHRSFQKFGNRILPSGDLYEIERAFFDMVRSRTENYVEEWVQTLKCKIIRIDGTESVKENIGLIVEQIRI